MDLMQTDIMLVYTERCHHKAMRKEVNQLEAALCEAKKDEERPHDYPPLASFDDGPIEDIRELRGRIRELCAMYNNITDRYISHSKYVKLLTHRLRDTHGEAAVEQLKDMVQELSRRFQEHEQLQAQLQLKKLRHGVGLIQQCIAGSRKNPLLMSELDQKYIKNLTRVIERLVNVGAYRSDIKAIRSLILAGKVNDEEVVALGERIADAYAYAPDENLETNAKALRKDASSYHHVCDEIRKNTLVK